MTTTTVPAPLRWTTVSAGRHTTTDGQFLVVRDANAAEDNRWTLRRKGGTGPISSHRLLASAKSRAQRIVADDAAIAGRVLVPILDDLHADALLDNRRFDRFAAQHRRGGTPEMFPIGTDVLISTSSRGGIPVNLQPGTVVDVVRGTMHIRYAPKATVRGATMAMRHTYVEAVDDQDLPTVRGPIDKAAILAKPIDSLMNSGVFTPQPEQQHAQADQPAEVSPVDAILAYYRRTQQWPDASQVVRAGADLDDLYESVRQGLIERFDAFTRDNAVFRLPVPAPGRPLAVDDIVTVDPMRESRQFTVIALDEIDNTLVRVTPRAPMPYPVEDRPRWVSAEYTHRIPPALILPVDDSQDAEQVPQRMAACDGCGTEHPVGEMTHSRIVDAGSSESDYRCRDCEPLSAERITTTTAARRAEFVDPWEGTAVPEPPVASIGIAAAGKLGAAGLSVAVCSRGDYRSAPTTEAQARKRGDDHLLAVHSGKQRSIRDMLLPAMPEQYRQFLTHVLDRFEFTVPDGPLRGDANPEAFLIHVPTGLAIGTYDRHLRLSYPALHAGEGDGDLGEAYADLEYGTSFEVVADIAIGLIARIAVGSADAAIAARRHAAYVRPDAECGAVFTTTARLGTTFHCARPPHGEDLLGHSVMRYPEGGFTG